MEQIINKRRWKVSVDGEVLRKALEEQDVKTVLKEIRNICEELKDNDDIGEVGKYAFEEFLDEEVAFREEDDDIEVLELFIHEFWNLCDKNDVWVTIGISTQNGVV